MDVVCRAQFLILVSERCMFLLNTQTHIRTHTYVHIRTHTYTHTYAPRVRARRAATTQQAVTWKHPPELRVACPPRSFLDAASLNLSSSFALYFFQNFHHHVFFTIEQCIFCLRYQAISLFLLAVVSCYAGVFLINLTTAYPLYFPYNGPSLIQDTCQPLTAVTKSGAWKKQRKPMS
jgi:hypothetical protein